MASITLSNGSASVSTTPIFTSTGGAGTTPQTTKGFVQGFFNLGNLVAGDRFVIGFNEKINGGAAVTAWSTIVEGIQVEYLITPMFLAAEGWDFVMIKLAGADETINWSVRQDLSGEGATVGLSAGAISAATFSANAIDSSALAASAATEVAAAVMAQTVDNVTVVDALKVLVAALGGKADGFLTGTHHYRNLQDTKNRITATVTTAGRTAVTLDLT